MFGVTCPAVPPPVKIIFFIKNTCDLSKYTFTILYSACKKSRKRLVKTKRYIKIDS